MNRALRAIAASVFVASAAFGTAPAVAMPVDADETRAAIEARVAAMPGAAIVAAKIDHGKLTTYLAGSSGTDRPLDDHTLFEIGSVTKTFTATALASMVRDGTVRLSDPVARYLPSDVRMPSRGGKEITLENLATQHSGLPRIPANLDATAADPYANYTPADLYAFLQSYALPRDPGSEYEYSNLGFGLLGFALVRADRKTSYGDLIASRVFRRLGMTSSATTLDAADRKRVALGHTEDGDPAPPWTFADTVAGLGAINSDLADMIRYLKCNMGDGPEAATCLFAQEPRSTFPGYRIGLAWQTSLGSGVIDHDGATVGYQAIVMMNADRSKGAVVLGSGPAVTDIAAHMLDPASSITPPAPTRTLPANVLDRYAGTYRNEVDGLTYRIAVSGGRLEARIVGQPAAAIYPLLLPDHFYYRVVPASIAFFRKNNRVVGLVLSQGGGTFTYYRLGADGKPLASTLVPSYPTPFAVDAPTLTSYAGSYAVDGTPTFVVEIDDGRLYAQLAGQNAFEIYAYAKDEFYYKVVDAQITFTRAPDGAVSGLVLHQNGRDLIAVKHQAAPQPSPAPPSSAPSP